MHKEICYTKKHQQPFDAFAVFLNIIRWMLFVKHPRLRRVARKKERMLSN